MAYLIGLVTDEEKRELISRGFELEKCPAELIPTDPECGETNPDKYVLIYLDANLLDVIKELDHENRYQF